MLVRQVPSATAAAAVAFFFFFFCLSYFVFVAACGGRRLIDTYRSFFFPFSLSLSISFSHVDGISRVVVMNQENWQD